MTLKQLHGSGEVVAASAKSTAHIIAKHGYHLAVRTMCGHYLPIWRFASRSQHVCRRCLKASQS